MNEPITLIMISLLALILIVLLWQGFVLVTIARRLDRPAAKSKRHDGSEIPASSPERTPAIIPPQTDFDRFLLEEPARQQLGKKEQAAAYRIWRKDQGLTWNQ